MKIVSITLSGYRQYADPVSLIIPDGLIGICGPNGVGKSKLVESIGYALYGPSRYVLPKGDKAADLPSKASPGAVPRVRLVLELRGQQYEIIRTTGEATIRVLGAKDCLAESPSGVNAKVVELLGLSPGAYSGTFVARQKEVSGLQEMTPATRQRLVNRLLGIALVEEAINIATDKRRDRQSLWQAEERMKGASVAECVKQYDEREAEWQARRIEEETAKQALSAAQAAYDSARERSEMLRSQRAEIEARQRELAALASHRSTLEATRAKALGQLQKTKQAAGELSLLKKLIEETAGAPEVLARQLLIAAIHQLRPQEKELRNELEERVLPGLEQRRALQQAIADDAEALALLDRERVEHSTKRLLAENSAGQARHEAERAERQQETARALGPSGKCEACGQSFGDSLADALSHYAKEASDAREREHEALGQVEATRSAEEEVCRKIARRQAERAARERTIASYDKLPGEEASLKNELVRLKLELAAFPDELLNAAYDPASHEAARAAVARREEAESAVRELSVVAGGEAEAEEAARSAEREIQQLAGKESAIQSAIGAGSAVLVASQQAETEMENAKQNLAGANLQFRDASRRAAQAEARKEGAALEVARAEERERSIARAQRSLLVANRAVEILGTLLREITEEARPRLAELMDGWGRSLLGSRFRSIDLSTDYRIIADNGSGPHLLEHFSGGEQTLLAVMLRVAISMFCQERAGFDTGFLILDEVFGDQDGDHRSALVQFLNEIKDQYHQVLVVNHVEDVTAMLDSVIDVQPTGTNSSTASLRL